MTIEEFIEARFAEDEAIATAAASEGDWGDSWHHDGDDDDPASWRLWGEDCVTTELPEKVARHAARHDPGRALRQVAALRAVVGRQAGEHRNDGGICETCRDYDFHREYRPVPWPCLTARAIAGIWSDHPDYQPEWAPA